ncbi:MAG: UPF0182 family protein [Clostridia bacterium]
MEKKKILTLRRILVTVFLIVCAVIAYINFRGSYLEYKELGENYLQTFLTKEKYYYRVLIINFILVYIIMYFSGRKIKKGLKVFFEQENKQVPRLPNKSIAVVTAIIESLIVGQKFTPNIILWISNTSFREVDAVFGLDVSFFMFIEPLLKMAVLYFIAICIGIIIYTFIYYVIVFNKYFDGVDRETLKQNLAMKTLYRNIRLVAIGLCAYIVVCSMDIVFDNFLTTDNGIKLAGAGLVDSTIKYWGYNILGVVLLVSIFRAINSFKKGKQSKILKDLIVVPIYLVALFIVMLMFDLIFVNQNEFDKEKKYIESNISTTKKAYGIDCDSESIDYTGTITDEEVQKNQNIIDNATIVDKQTVLENLNETQASSGYYTYKIAKISSYEVNGMKKLMYVSPREIINNRRTYNSKTYEYTHGYGLIFTSSTESSDDGTIRYIQNDIAGKESNIIKVNEPRIYYGLETNTTVVTNAKDKKEFDYSDEQKDYETSYNGEAGLKMNFLDRLILGIKEKNVNIALSGSVTSESKILINRNIIKRARLALSDVIYDNNPYTVLDENGDIYWVIDAYTVSSSYPYSTYTEIEYNGQKRDINYIRNSIKVIINSYTGEMKYYITDRTDPIAMAYRKVYPELFQDLDSEISKTIQDQFIYPEFLYNVQSTMLEEYHNTKADVLYRSDNTWEKATYKNQSTNNKTKNTLKPYYTMVSNSDEEETIGLIQIYTPKNKQNISSYLIGTVENGQNKLTLKTLHSDTSILGPTQLDTQIAQDETIQSQIDSLSVTGAKVTRNMIIVPVENTLLYIEPIYQTLVNESNIPVLKKVIVASGNKVAIGNNLQEATQSLISKSATKIELNSTDDIEGLIDSIIKANDNLSESLESNNWEIMGTDIQKLQSLINTLKKKNNEEKKNDNNTVAEENIVSNETVTE